VLSKITKKGGGRVSSGCSQTSQKNGGGCMSSGCSQKSQKTVIVEVEVIVVVVVVVVVVTHAIYSIYNIDMYICPGQLPPEQIIVETMNPVM
jgi:hypothetical protein